MKRRLGLLRGVDVRRLLTVHELLVMIDGGVDAAVANRLGHDELGVVAGGEAELLRDVREGDAAVCEADAPQTRADDVTAKARDEVRRLVRLEHAAVSLHHDAELLQVPQSHRLRQVQVGLERGTVAGEALGEILSAGARDWLVRFDSLNS